MPSQNPIEQFKNVIIGSGEGGKSLAWHLAQSGEKTTVVERRWIGGSCPNINCLPSKNEIWSAKVADLVRHSNQFGITTGTATIDIAAVRRRKRQMVDALVAIHVAKYKSSGAELKLGEATITSSSTVDVKLNDGSARTLQAERLFLNLGTRATLPPVPGLKESGPLTHIEMLELDRLPEHLVVIGGGYVGLEFAQAYRRFGSRVTIIQHGPQLLAGQDPDVAAEILNIFVNQKIEVLTSADLLSVTGRSGSVVTLLVRLGDDEKTIHATDILVATGRTPNTTGISLESAGIQLDPHGFIKVNDRLQTTAANVWAIGECCGTPQFTHASFDDYRVIRDNLAGGNHTTTGRVMPSCLYTDPPLAHIGLSESEAKQRNIPYRLARIPIAAVLRSRTLDETTGFMKALIHPATDRILGFTMIGPEAGEVLATVQVTMLAGMPFTVLRDAILTHPTMAEGLNVLFASVPPA
jgi:pyruvate/2-oxoglutarate dehydrogenase complex dihydrolipoamide dehydrogenase (E3) component